MSMVRATLHSGSHVLWCATAGDWGFGLVVRVLGFHNGQFTRVAGRLIESLAGLTNRCQCSRGLNEHWGVSGVFAVW